MEALPLPRSFDAASVPAWLGEWARAQSAPELTLHVPRACLLRPAGVALLASAVAWRRSQGRKTRCEFESAGSDAERYLQRMDFFRELGIPHERGFQADEAPERIELRRLRDLRVARDLAERIRSCLEQQFPEIAPSASRLAAFVFEELCANVVQHSEVPDTGFGLAQADPLKGTIEIAVCDAGVGFLASLRRNPELATRLADIGQALQYALSSRITRQGPGNLGVGLAQLRELVTRLAGRVWIASGDALLNLEIVGGSPVTSVRRIPAWQGAWVCLETPVPRVPSS